MPLRSDFGNEIFATRQVMEKFGFARILLDEVFKTDDEMRQKYSAHQYYVDHNHVFASDK